MKELILLIVNKQTYQLSHYKFKHDAVKTNMTKRTTYKINKGGFKFILCIFLFFACICIILQLNFS